jgi:hypothetical protein
MSRTRVAIMIMMKTARRPSGKDPGGAVHLRRQKADRERNASRKRCGKHKDDGTLVGSYHLTNDSIRQYEVEFSDGAREAYVYNTIAQALYSRLDADGERWYSF